MRTVTIVFRDYDYDGYSAPIAVFDTIEETQEYIESVKKEYETWDIETLEIGEKPKQ